MSSTPQDDNKGSAWSPEIRSTLPPQYLPLSTMFRPENVFTSMETANELSGFTGLPLQQLICFRPQRLVVHELLIRVSADIFVSDGSKYEDLGVNFRKVVVRILNGYIEPHMAQIIDRHLRLREDCETMIAAQLDADLYVANKKTEQSEAGFSLARLFRAKPPRPAPGASETPQQAHQRILDGWRQKAGSRANALSGAVFGALAQVANALIIKHGRIIGDKALLTSLSSGLLCNQHGSEMIGEMIAPYILQAAEQEGYRLLPAQSEPVVINVKGASASGKSTMRPAQQKHVEKLGLNWQDFALISPDIWRKYLLDYDSLGEAYKYAGTLAGDEIPIVDQKLDRYIGKKAAAGKISHLLIDRFRFDSFAPGRDTEQGSNLLTRFGHTVYLIFMVTPPPATVERAWLRGKQVGRYKAVDDLLDHNIEAFNGIPVLFFTWALRHDKTVYYEFLDNSVAHKETPKTIAFGLNEEMYIVELKCMLDIVRYTKINIDAGNPDDVYPVAADMAPGANTAFLVDCASKIPRINFVERETGLIYAAMEAGHMQWIDRDLLQRVVTNGEAQAALLAMAPRLMQDLEQIPKGAARPVPEEVLRHTLGDME
ncbi:MAG: ATP-binding protein [Gammaproteobacteria bacterium]|nr:ATP-binding protein [Gammaproteobacteria bacterium]